jgi:hypothetical protein
MDEEGVRVFRIAKKRKRRAIEVYHLGAFRKR